MRRFHVPHLPSAPARLTLDPAQARHAAGVLRLVAGDTVELFDSAGASADARLLDDGAVEILALRPAVTIAQLRVASAVPKGDRADWLVEKLTELGVARWTPLRTARSVVHPDGPAKLARWERIAIEAAKQSRRAGVLTIAPLTDVAALTAPTGWFLSTRGGIPADRAPIHDPLDLLIGPEGGWTDDEELALAARGLTAVTLGPTILRVETAAIAAATVAALRLNHPP